MDNPSSPAPTRPPFPFARAYPSAPELDRLLAAFSAGNYAEVRRLAPALAAKATDPAVRDAIRDVRRRVDPDPLAFYLLGLTFALLAFVTAWAYLHKH